MNKRAEQLLNIEREFFEFDDENKKVKMELAYDKPSDIIDNNAISKTPLLNDDFMEWVKTAIEYTPNNHRIDVDISFNDLEGYTNEDLQKIFFKNVFLEGKRSFRKTAFKNKIALSLCLIGLCFLVAMILLLSLWKDGGVPKEIVSYIFDIATTVSFWEALTIIIAENKIDRDTHKKLMQKFDAITFHKK